MGPVAESTQITLNALELTDTDTAAATLALKLAEALDNEKSGRTISELSAKLLAVLESLGATPAARKALQKGAPAIGTTSESGALADLRRLH
ncbi:terminase small subunit [Amycolatopsis japonica]